MALEQAFVSYPARWGTQLVGSILMSTTTFIRPAVVRSASPRCSIDQGSRRPQRPIVVGPGGTIAHRFFRRRVVAALVVTAVLVGGTVRAVAAFGVGPASGTERRPAVHVVVSGETMWSIAQSLRPGGDTVKLVHQLMKLNGGADLQVGQRLVLPGS